MYRVCKKKMLLFFFFCCCFDVVVVGFVGVGYLSMTSEAQYQQ